MEHKKEFVPGFDWVKLIGCIVIAAHHLLPRRLPSSPATFPRSFSSIIPVFFLMSGYLMHLSLERRKDPVHYMHRYILRYGAVYFVLNLFANILHYLQIYQQTGVLMIKDFLLVMCSLPLWQGPMYQLWFIPALILGMYCAVHAFLHRKELLYGALLIPTTAAVILFSTYGVPFLGFSAADFSYTYHAVVLQHFTQGLTFVYLGMLLARYRSSSINLALFFFSSLAVLIAETLCAARILSDSSALHAFSFSQYFISVLLFLLILRIPGSFLQKHHRMINSFSVLMYLLHPLQYNLFKTWIPDPYLLFPLVILLNAAAAFALLTLKTYIRKHYHGF